MTQIEELIYKFGMDTEDADRGADRIEKAFERIGKAQNKADRGSTGGHGKAGGHGMGNMGMGVHDMLMGREQAALGRFASGLKVAGAYAVGMGVALEVGGRALDYVKAKTDEVDSAAQRLEQSYLRVSKAANITSTANGSQAALGVLQSATEQVQGEKDQQLRLSELTNLQESPLSWRDPTAGLIYKLQDWKQSWTGLDNSQMVDQANLERRRAEQIAAKARGEYREALGDERDDLQSQIFNNPYQARFNKIDRSEKAEIDAARGAGVTDPASVAAIKDRHELQREALWVEQKADQRRLDTEKQIAELRSNGSKDELQAAKLRLEEFKGNLDDQPEGSYGAEQANNAYLKQVAAVEDIQFQRGQQSYASAGQTAAGRLSLYGRDDLAGLVTSRVQSTNQASAYRRDGLGDMADDVEDRQAVREQQARVNKYLNADGTRRNPGEIVAEETAQRRKAMRIDQFLYGTKDTDTGGGLHSGGLESGDGILTAASGRLARSTNAAGHLAMAAGPTFAGTALSRGAEMVGGLGNLGLTGIAHGMDGSILSARDAITGQTLNATQIHEREAQAKRTADYHAANAKDDRSDREVQQDIFKVLNDRLPSTTTK